MGKYKFTFQNIGGTTRVKLQSGEDICHLAELDEKMWTVLSCPTKGLHIDEKTLAYIDTTGDERIHVNEVISAAQWLTSVVKNPDEILNLIKSSIRCCPFMATTGVSGSSSEGRSSSRKM
mgnify:CR=1 FL=1